MEIGPLSGDVCLKGGFLPLPYGTPVFSNELLLIIDPDLLIRCLNSYLLSYVADWDAVERARAGFSSASKIDVRDPSFLE